VIRILPGIAIAAQILAAPPPAAPGAHPALAPCNGMTIGSIRTYGTDAPVPRRLLRMLGLAPGAVYDSVAVERARRDILRLGWLRDLRVNAVPTGGDSLLLGVLVTRAPRARLEPLVHWLPDEKIVLGATLGVWGNAGRGESFKLRVAGVGQEIVQAEWNEPRPFVSIPVSLRFHADVVQELVEPEDDIEFGRVVAGAVLGVRLGGPVLELSGSTWDVRASDPSGLMASGGRDELRRGGAALVWGRPPAPYAGSALARVGVGATTGAAESQDVSVWLQASHRLTGRCALAGAFLYHDVRGTVPRYLRHHLGAGPSLRGFDYGSVNGDAAAWGGLELRFPLNFTDPASFHRNQLPLELHLFSDAGAAWGASAPGATSEALERDRARLRWSVGAGFGAFVRGTRPLRVDLGRDDGGVWRAQVATSLPF
jgi:hypothetical protein